MLGLLEDRLKMRGHGRHQRRAQTAEVRPDRLVGDPKLRQVSRHDVVDASHSAG